MIIWTITVVVGSIYIYIYIYIYICVYVLYRYIQYDSWWYYKGKGEGVKTWIARPDVFPDGFVWVFYDYNILFYYNSSSFIPRSFRTNITRAVSYHVRLGQT